VIYARRSPLPFRRIAQEPCHAAHRKRLILKCRFGQIPLPRIRCFWAIQQRG
jgi:hypothetical protein